MALNLQNNAPAQRPAPPPSSKPAPAKAPPKPKAAPSVGAFTPSAPMSQSQIVAAAKALTNSETQGPLAQLAQEISTQNRANANAVKQIAGYFTQLGKYVKGDNAQVSSAAADLNGKLGTIATNLNQGLNGISTAAQQQTSAYTPAGDADVSAAGQQALISALAQQHGLATTNMGAFKAEGAEQGTNAKQLAAQLGASYMKGGQEDLGTIRAAGQAAITPLTQKVASDEATREADIGSNYTKLAQQEAANHQAGITNYQNQEKIDTDNAALGVTKYKAVTGATNSAAAIAERGAAAAAATRERGEATAAEVAARNAALHSKNAAQGWTETYQSGELNLKKSAQQWQQTYQQAELNLKKAAASPAAPPPKLTPNENNEMTDMLSKATAYVHEFSSTMNHKQIVQTLATGGKAKDTSGNTVDIPSLNPTLVEAAFEIAHKGTLKPATAKAMRNMGITNPTYNGKPLIVR